jgi:tRNA A37 methylthiotransferase MiaB
MRIRFTSPHPKDFNDATLEVVAAHDNICKHLHMPAQSGSTSVLQRMRRGYSREAYDALLARAKSIIPNATFSTDIIVGFCGETEADHQQTLDLLEQHRFAAGYLFAYSDRERTHAARHYDDDVPADIKKRRLAEALAVFKRGVSSRREELIGSRQMVRI